MVEKPTISIALCTYNGEKYLAEQVTSILAQTLPPTEIVICDDGSTDSTIPLLEKLSTKTNIPVHIHRNEERLGVTKNFQKAIGLCAGDYIALCDQDDVWLNDKLEKEIKIFDMPGNENIAVVFSDVLLVDDKLRSLGKTMWQHLKFDRKMQRKWRNEHALDILIRYGNVVTGSSILLRSSFRPIVLPLLSKPGKVWIHDGLIAIAAARKKAISFVDEVTVLYRQHEQQSVGGGWHQLPVPLKTRVKKLWNQKMNVVQEVDELLDSYKKHKEDLLSLGFTEKDLLVLDPVIKHFTKRRYLPVERLKRIPAIMGEWISLGYFKYSGSIIMQAIKDWLVKRTIVVI